MRYPLMPNRYKNTSDSAFIRKIRGIFYKGITVFFHEDHVFIGGKEYPIGQCCVDIVNLDESVLKEIDQRVWKFIPAAQALLTEKTDSAAALAQEKLNAVWDIVFFLPVYRDLKMDEACNYHAFQRLMADQEKWVQVQNPASDGYFSYQGMLTGLACFTDDLRRFRQQIMVMTERYFEPLKLRDSGAYADAYSQFYAQVLLIGTQVFHEDFDQSFPMEVNFVPMMHRTEKDMMFIAEKATFTSLTSFLRTEFYRGLPKEQRRAAATIAENIFCCQQDTTHATATILRRVRPCALAVRWERIAKRPWERRIAPRRKRNMVGLAIV